MYRTRKRLSLLLVIFFLTIITGAVYAATSGTLSFQSNVTLRQNATELSFTYGSLRDVTSTSGAGFGRYSISADGQTITFEVLLTQPSDSVTLSYNVKNTGNTNANIQGARDVFEMFQNTPLRVLGDHHLNHGSRLLHSTAIFAPDGVVENAQITFEWVAGVDDDFNGTALVFEFALNYFYTNLPATVRP
jgi:hypothetical protein